MRVFGQPVNQLLLCSITTEALISDLKLELQSALESKLDKLLLCVTQRKPGNHSQALYGSLTHLTNEAEHLKQQEPRSDSYGLDSSSLDRSVLA